MLHSTNVQGSLALEPVGSASVPPRVCRTLPWLRHSPVTLLLQGCSLSLQTWGCSTRWFHVLLGALGPVEERRANKYPSREAVCKPEEGAVRECSEEVVLLCVLRRVRALLSRTTLAVFFSKNSKHPPRPPPNRPSLLGGSLSYACYALLCVAWWTGTAAVLLLWELPPLCGFCSHSL